MIRLVGPAAFDPLAPGRAARGLLDRLANEPDDLPEGDGAEPGLYLLLDERQLRGFWVTLGASWLDEGTVAGVTPPFARAMLDAAVEALWWARYDVGPLVLGAWRPIVVLEWTAALAVRSNLPPPGVPSAQATAPVATGTARWLVAPEAGAAGEDAAEGAVPWANLPAERSLVCVLRGSMRWARNVHEGRFELVQLPAPEEEGQGIASMPASWRKRGLPLEEWVEVAAGQAARPEGDHHLGFPLQLPGNRVGFPVTGWLTRDLEVQPPRPADAAVGGLVSRDTRNPVLARTAQAMAVTALVLAGTLGFSGGLQWISRPAIETAAPAIQPAAQPAFSVCSAEHGRFVDQLSCEIAHLAAGSEPGGASCTGWRHGANLQATWCGLRDRDLDGGRTARGHAWADAAAAQACFEVLGRPYDYTLRPAEDAVRGSQPPLANPVALLEDPRLKVTALGELVESLDSGCAYYRDRVATFVDGAILAAHVGDGGDDGSGLRREVFGQAASGLPRSLQPCLDSGGGLPLESATSFESLCPGAGGAERDDRDPDRGKELEIRASQPWSALDGPADDEVPSVVDRYARARFALGWPSSGRWACHRRLVEGSARAEAPAAWDLTVPVPGGYAEGGVRTQIALDAKLTHARDPQRASDPAASDVNVGDVCWPVVDRLLAAYTPVHPLLGAPPPDAWPSVEQRVCGQVCAVNYRLAAPPAGPRVTPTGDLATCLDTAPPFDPRTGGADGVFDRLALPWNQLKGGGWQPPSPETLCAFHLVAQGYVPDVLAKDVAPTLWAGQPIPGSKLAGGRDGAAAEAAEALVRYGRNRSYATCSRAAAQCFVERLLRVTGDPSSGPQLWSGAWRRDLDSLVRASPEDLIDSPWCRVLRPYLYEPGRLPEGDLDFPCALGVAETRDRVSAVLDRLVAGNATAGAAGGPR
jgi:hypothetical protein